MEQQPLHLTGVEVRFHSQIAVELYQRETLEGATGIVFNDSVRKCIEILDQEVGIWALSFPSDISEGRLVATMSIDDAKLLQQDLLKKLNPTQEELAKYPKHNYPLKNFWPEGEFKGAVILPEPKVATNSDLPTIILETNRPIIGRKELFILQHPDSLNLLVGITKILKTNLSRGKGAIDIEKKVHPERVITF